MFSYSILSVIFISFSCFIVPIWSDSLEEDDGMQIENEYDDGNENPLGLEANDTPALDSLNLIALGLGAFGLDELGLGTLNFDGLGEILPQLLSIFDTLQQLFAPDGIENALVRFFAFIEEIVQHANNPTELLKTCQLPKPIDMLVLKNPFHAYQNVDENFPLLNIIQKFQSELGNFFNEQINDQQQIPVEGMKDEL